MCSKDVNEIIQFQFLLTKASILTTNDKYKDKQGQTVHRSEIIVK